MAGAPNVLIEKFERLFAKTPDVFRAPGRVNLIGEHTDYNGGFVLPIAINMACYAASAPNRQGVLRVHSENFNETREWPIASLQQLTRAGHWTDYVIGVAQQLHIQRGYDLLIESEVPIGSGLSSSAAIEVSTALALGYVETTNPVDLAKLCRAAENQFVGVPTGIMDQYIAVMGRENAAVCIDCRSLENRTVTLPSCAIVAVNTNVKHELGQSAYRERVAQCAAAVKAIQARRPEVKELRDARLPDLDAIPNELVRRRAKHVITENARVLEFEKAAHAGDLPRMGELFVESHRSLQHDYEVTSAELDFLVDTALRIPGVYGSRMTGGGFGGCTVTLLDQNAVEQFTSEIRESYRREFQIDPPVYNVQPSAGASKLF